jgi:hypothetical protein
MRYALEITSVHRIRPTPEERTRALRTCLLRRRYPAPNDGVEVKDLRPLTRSALAGRSLTPTPQPALPKSGGERQKKDQQSGSRSTTSTRRRAPATPRILRVGGQVARQGPVGGRVDPGRGKHAQRVQLAGRLDDPGQHQRPEHLITAGRGVEAQRVVGPAQRVPQLPHPRGCDLQRPGGAHGPRPGRGRARPARRPAAAGPRPSAPPPRPRRSPSPDARCSATLDAGVHDLHRRRSRRRPHVDHDRTLRARLVRKSAPVGEQTHRSHARHLTEATSVT